jgi:cysteine desulfurase
MQRIYLDHNATTPSLPSVVDAMLPYLRGAFANPSSAHSGGHEARAAVEQARAHVATLVGSRPESVLFASSATEAINTAFASVCNRQPFTKGRIVVTAVEHAAVLECAELAGSHGHDVVRVRVDSSGQLDLDQLQNALTDDTLLVSAMWANNETGVIFPIAEVVRLCANRGVPIHVDAVQAAGKFPISLLDLDVDYVSISGHKIYGPKGAAALIAAEPATVRPLIVGGNQESGRRAGTENVPAIVGFGEAARLARIELDRRSIRSAHLRDRLENAILEQVSGSYCNGAGQPRLANTANIGFDGIDADSDEIREGREETTNHINAIEQLLEDVLAAQQKRQADAQRVQLVVKEREALIRSGPESRAPVIARARPYQAVWLIEDDGKWIRVEYDDPERQRITGWALKMRFAIQPSSR